MEIKYYDYDSGAVPHPVTSAQFSVHHAACWFQGRQDTDRTQTEHRQGTDRTQKGHRQNTDRTQIGHRQNTDITQTENRQDTDRTQTGHRQDTDRTHPVTSAQFNVHHAACWFQGRQDSDRPHPGTSGTAWIGGTTGKTAVCSGVRSPPIPHPRCPLPGCK